MLPVINTVLAPLLVYRLSAVTCILVHIHPSTRSCLNGYLYTYVTRGVAVVLVSSVRYINYCKPP